MKNHKPSVEFDKLFRTNISQQYKFPFNLTTDEVWDIIQREKNYWGGEIKDWKLKVVIDNLDFPYVDIKSLSDFQKFTLISGMASCFNSDDIIWFMEGNYASSPKGQEIEREMDELLDHTPRWYIQWVPSRKTWETMKEQMFTLP